MWVYRDRENSCATGEHRPSCLRKKTGLDFVSEMPGHAEETEERTRGNLIRQNTRPCSLYLLVLFVEKPYIRNKPSRDSATVLRTSEVQTKSNVPNESKLDFELTQQNIS